MSLSRRTAHRARIVVTLVCSLLASACLLASVQRAAAATWTTVVNQIHTYMKYGPFDLTGAIDAKVNFDYWLDTEPFFDFCTYGYSCDGGRKWTETSVSGGTQRWKAGKTSLASCVGQTQVLVRFGFVSDYSGTDQGVWLDDIKIRKLS